MNVGILAVSSNDMDDYPEDSPDGSRPGNDIPVTGKDIRAAIDAVLAGREVSQNQKPSMGCNIKWKRGNEPEYFLLHYHATQSPFD